nr:tRNA dihydrouridine synthase DusB [Chachezhania antarctica]
MDVRPPVLLAPMAGITDRPFRDLALRYGAGMVVSEMVASQEMVQAKPGVREKAELGAGTAGTSVQLAGRDPVWIAEAARQVADRGARVIDINMGCPAKKVTNGYSGSALMRTPDHALRMIEAVVGAVDVPVTLKMRLGWDDDCLNAPSIAQRAESAGVAMITVHGRTRCQFYKGRADWAAVAGTKASVGVPVVVNGDIVDATSARAALKASGADGVMIGRGAQGRPWLPGQVAHLLYGTSAPDVPNGAARGDVVAAHYEAMLEFYGLDLGVRVARKHLGWYLDAAAEDAGTDVPKPLRRAILTSTDPRAVIGLIRAAFADALADTQVAA